MSEEAAQAVLPAAPAAAVAQPAESGTVPAQNPAESAPATPKGNETKPDTPDLAEQKRGQSRFDRKIGRLHREAAEQKARAEFFEKKYNEVQKPAVAGEPKLADFDFDPEKYATAKAEYVKEQAFKERDTKQRSESVKQERERLLAGWEEKAEKGEAKYEDFDEKVGQLTKYIGMPAVDAIMEAENAEDVAYYFANNPKEFERIAQLSPRSQIREIGKLEAKLLAEPAKPKTPSKAPAPIAPLSGASNAASDEPSETDDMKTWIRKRQKQAHGR